MCEADGRHNDTSAPHSSGVVYTPLLWFFPSVTKHTMCILFYTETVATTHKTLTIDGLLGGIWFFRMTYSPSRCVSAISTVPKTELYIVKCASWVIVIEVRSTYGKENKTHTNNQTCTWQFFLLLKINCALVQMSQLCSGPDGSVVFLSRLVNVFWSWWVSSVSVQTGQCVLVLMGQ